MNETEEATESRSRRLWYKFISMASTVLLIVAVAFCVYVIYQSSTVGYVNLFGHSFFRVVSDSMEPELAVGALIMTSEEDFDNIQEGDIICFTSKDSLYGQVITHRVVGITEYKGERALRTKGDHNNSEDGSYVLRDNYIAKVTYYTKSGSFIEKIYMVMTDRVGFFSFLVIPIVIIVVFILKENLRKMKKEIDEARRMLQEEEKEHKELSKPPNGEEIAESSAEGQTDEIDRMMKDYGMKREDIQKLYSEVRAEILQRKNEKEGKGISIDDDSLQEK